ncbi:NAD-dependent epimerase/dehydratase family protein [Mycolicibacterium obuense]|uniref:NAD dependent epimerase/dehydratase family protein n=1 Tax=Mycolicibacterium obuense TaxID=1807 RepID=A0A0J6VIN0_9MYCO|nr:NAD-dependent epimerase/dehydratase family protein [Mycolicibacterium obuense]KMO69447.1 NAD dependent epimerase/dehydratase family protein [Mycolicibacterium obuense]
MHVFATGGTGTLGTPVVAELLAHGHTVLALARSDASAAALEAAGAETLRGSLEDLDSLREGARRTDGVVHLAFGRDYSSPESLARGVAEETAALQALGAEMQGTDRPIVAASGTPWVAGRAAVETDPPPTDGVVGERGRAVLALLGLDGVRASAVRMPRTAHANGEGGFAGLLTEAARRTGIAGYPGDGAQRWPAVHARDAAALFRLALESAPAGTSWHAVAEEGVAVRDIAEVVGRRLDLPVQSVAEGTFGPFGAIFALDQPARSEITRATLGWAPTHPGLLEDLENLTP